MLRRAAVANNNNYRTNYNYGVKSRNYNSLLQMGSGGSGEYQFEIPSRSDFSQGAYPLIRTEMAAVRQGQAASPFHMAHLPTGSDSGE